MNINFMTHFPWPGKDGKPEETGFREKILNGIYPQMAQMPQIREKGSKLHTIQRVPDSGKARFRKGMKLTFSIGPRFKPERFCEAMCTDTQLLRMELLIAARMFDAHPGWNQGRKQALPVLGLSVRQGARRLSADELAVLAGNDGLTEEEFVGWFILDLLTNGPREYQIVHWTDLRY